MVMGQIDMDIIPESMSEGTGHIPVMLNEVIEHLRPRPGQVIVDGTLGLGGHALSLLKLIGQSGRLIGIDRDQLVLQKAQENLKEYKSQCHFVHDNFCHMQKILTDLHVDHVDAILLDLGLSSFQLDDPQRGFGFGQDGPLDMRMDQNIPMTASNLVNSCSEKEISAILKEYGQERWHHRIARSIVYERTKHPVSTTQELCNIILRAMPRQNKWQKIHPATRTFQAFRIAVNKELVGLEEALDHCSEMLNFGGRIAVISFHSLEDRIVKHKFRDFSKAGTMKLLFKKPLRPSYEETKFNRRARSARLRIAERNATATAETPSRDNF